MLENGSKHKLFARKIESFSKKPHCFSNLPWVNLFVGAGVGENPQAESCRANGAASLP
jgi:hypothetical protein